MIAKHFVGVALGIAFLFHSQQAHSQIWMHDKLRQAPSPDAASLGSFVNVPIANSAGLIPIDVPLASLKTGTVEMSISLSYSASGIPVEQEATSVGMGWSLNCGGVISRSIRGTADDLLYGVQSSVVPDGKNYIGWLHSATSRKLAINFPYNHWAEIYGGTLQQKQGYVLGYINPRTSSAVNDTEPDIYYVNAGPVKAKFIFDNDGKVRFLGRTDLKVEYTFYPFGSECGQVVCGLDNFTIVDAKGNRYLFDQKEVSKLETDEADFYTWRPPNVATIWYYYTSAWFLSKVTSPDGHEIVYEYSNYTLKQMPRLSETRKSCVEGDCQSYSGNTVGHRLSIDTKILSSARDSFTKVSFDVSGRDDLEGAKKFDKMTLRSYETNKLLREFEFQYFVQTATRGATGNVYFDKRLFLSKLREVNGSTVKGEYSFVYDRPEQLPSKRSTEQDFWGYFNGNGSTNLIPKLYVYPSLPAGDRYSLFPLLTYSGNEIQLIGANRNTNSNLITAGSLKEIVFPTKGKVIYRFEPHDFMDPQFGYQTGGGLRICNGSKTVPTTRLWRCHEADRLCG